MEWVSRCSEVRLSGFIAAWTALSWHFFWENGLSRWYAPGQTVQFWPHSVIHCWKAVHQTSDQKIWWIVQFCHSIKRQDFWDPLGINCNHYLIICQMSFSALPNLEFWQIRFLTKVFFFKIWKTISKHIQILYKNRNIALISRYMIFAERCENRRYYIRAIVSLIPDSGL